MNKRCIKGLAVAVAICGSNAIVAQVSPGSDEVYRSDIHEVTFRYPSDWVQKESRIDATMVHLWATDGSEGTCTMAAAVMPALAGWSEQQLDVVRKANHAREDFEKKLGGAFDGFSLTRHWRGLFGQKEAGVIEYRYETPINGKRSPLQAFMALTLANGRRYSLNCNGHFGRAETAKRAFDRILDTTVFSTKAGQKP